MSLHNAWASFHLYQSTITVVTSSSEDLKEITGRGEDVKEHEETLSV